MSKLSAAQGVLEMYLAKGEISFETYQKALKDLDHQFNPTTKAIDQLKTSITGVASTALTSTFDAIGKSLAAGASGASTFEDSMKSIVAQAASAAGQLMMTAGLKLMLGPEWPLGLALFLAGGGMEIVGGYMSYSSSSRSNGTSTSAEAQLAALTAYYQQAEQFNSQSASKGALHGYAQGGVPGGLSAYRNGIYDSPQFFRFASGGVFGEAGAEAIMPLTRTPSGDLGVKSAGGGMTVNVINNASGYEAKTEESTDASGAKVLTVTIEKIMANALVKGKMDGAMKQRYGAGYVGRSTT